MRTKKGEELNRIIGIRSLAINVMNLTIGAGIFVLPALVFEKLGNASGIAYLICGATIFLIMMCFAELGSKTTVSGGIYKYVDSAFGHYVGFLTSNLYWFGFGLISDAAISNALFEMLGHYVPFVDHLFGRIMFFLILFGTLTVVNILGVKYGVRVITGLTIAKLFPLVLLLVFGWTSLHHENLSLTSKLEFNNLGEACLILLFAFVGGEAALTTGGEIKNPKRTVPFGLLLGIGLVILIYFSIHILAQGILGTSLLDFKQAPLAEISGIVFGSGLGHSIILIASSFAILGALSGDILTMPRFLFAASKDNLLPELLSKVHPVYKTPYISIITYSFIAFVLSVSSSFKDLAILSSSANLITYAVVVLALWKLKSTKQFSEKAEHHFHIPKALLPLIFILIAWLLTNLTLKEIAALVIFLSVTSIYYFRFAINAWFKKKVL